MIEFPIPIIRSDADIFIYSDLPLDSLAPIHDSVYYLEEVEPSTSTARYSPSQILTYKECPTKYYLRYQLGLPEEPRLPYFNESDTFAESVQGTLVGQVIHKMLEHGSELLTGGIVDELKLGSILHSVSDELRLPNRTRALIEKRVKSDILIAFSTEIAKRAFGAEPNFTEIAIRSKVDDGQILSGIIDRLFMDDEGIWNVLDYKTDTRENEEKRTRHEFQVEFYSYLVSKLHNADRVRAHILYTHSGHTFSKEFNQNTFLGTRESLTAFILEIRAQKNAASLEKIRKNYSHCQDCQYFNQSDGKCIAGLGIITQ